MRYFLEEVFDIHNNIDNHAIDNAVYKVGILIDRGKYIHSSYINVDSEIINLIRKYIAESVADRVMYLDMYDDFGIVKICAVKNRRCGNFSVNST